MAMKWLDENINGSPITSLISFMWLKEEAQITLASIKEGDI